MSLKPTPGVGKSCTSRIFVRRSIALTDCASLSTFAPEEQVRELLRELGELLQVVSACARAARCLRERSAGRDQLLEQRRLAVGGRAEGAQVARVDAEPRELRAGGGDVGVRLSE